MVRFRFFLSVSMFALCRKIGGGTVRNQGFLPTSLVVVLGRRGRRGSFCRMRCCGLEAGFVGGSCLR